MENMKMLTENLSLNPYTHRSYSMKINNELFTANKSIIKAINEIYTNQQALMNSIIILYKKLNITIGDIVEDKELKNAYKALEFTNVIDGLVRLNNRINNLSSTALSQEIQEIQHILSVPTENVDGIFSTMNWDSVIDALVKINQRISEYIMNDTSSAAEEYTEIRDNISNLISIVGSDNESDRTKIQEKYLNIIKAVLMLDKFVAPSDNKLTQLNENGFASVSHAILEINNRLNTATTNIDNLNLSKVDLTNNFNNITEITNQLAADLQTLANSMGQATGTDLSNLGFTSIADGLQKLSAANAKLVEVIGDIDSTEDYATKYKSLGYQNMMAGITFITDIIHTVLGELDEFSMNTITGIGCNGVVDALNKVIELLGISDENTEYLEEHNYTSIINAISDIANKLTNLRTEINETGGSLTTHNSDPKAHPDGISGYFRHKVNHTYQEGEIVFVPELPNNMCLLCISGGTTGRFKPNFAAL